MILVANPCLTDGNLVLTPATLEEAKDLILVMAGQDRFNKTPREELERGLEHIKHVWFAGVNGVLIGVCFMTRLPNLNWWTFDAYANENIDNRVGDDSFRVGRLVTRWFFDTHGCNELYTMHRTKNRAATRVCRRIGFKEKFTNPEFNILSMRRNGHGN